MRINGKEFGGVPLAVEQDWSPVMNSYLLVQMPGGRNWILYESVGAAGIVVVTFAFCMQMLYHGNH